MWFGDKVCTLLGLLAGGVCATSAELRHGPVARSFRRRRRRCRGQPRHLPTPRVRQLAEVRRALTEAFHSSVHEEEVMG